MGLLSWVRYRHSLVIAPTGSGKTRLMFMIMRWCLLDDPNAILLLISPTKILGKAQHALLQVEAPDITSVWWDADSYTSQEKQQLSAGHFRLLVLSTESACSPWFKKITGTPFWKTHLKGVLVDEAHLALVWDFREWTWICELLRDTIQLMVLTGTLRNKSETKLLKVFGLHASLTNIIRVPIARYTLYSELCKRPGPSLTAARHPLYYFNPVVDQLCITGAECSRLVIFTRSVLGALQIFHYIRERAGAHFFDREGGRDKRDFRSWRVLKVFSDSPAEVLEYVQQQFVNDEPGCACRILIITPLGETGLDYRNMPVVLHVGPPDTVEQWEQRNGRVGRDGTFAHSIMFYTEAELRRCSDEVKAMARNKTVCRHKMMYRLFGEEFSSTGNCCDVCVAASKGAAPPSELKWLYPNTTSAFHEIPSVGCVPTDLLVEAVRLLIKESTLFQTNESAGSFWLASSLLLRRCKDTVVKESAFAATYVAAFASGEDMTKIRYDSLQHREAVLLIIAQATAMVTNDLTEAGAHQQAILPSAGDVLAIPMPRDPPGLRNDGPDCNPLLPANVCWGNAALVLFEQLPAWCWQHVVGTATATDFSPNMVSIEARIGVLAAVYLSCRSTYPSNRWSQTLESNAVIPLFQAFCEGHPTTFPRSNLNDSSMALDILLDSVCAVFPLVKSRVFLKTSSQIWGCGTCPNGLRNEVTDAIEESSIILSVMGETTVEAAIQHHFCEELILPAASGAFLLGKCSNCSKNTCNKRKLTLVGAPPEFLVVSPKINGRGFAAHGGRLLNVVPGSTFVFADFSYEIRGLTILDVNHYINLVWNSAGALVCVNNDDHSPCTAALLELASTNTVSIVCTRSPIAAAEDVPISPSSVELMSNSPSVVMNLVDSTNELHHSHPRSESFASPPGQPPSKKPALAVSTSAEHPMATTPEEYAAQTLAGMSMLGFRVSNAGRNASAGEAVGITISPLASARPFLMEDASAHEQVQAESTPPIVAPLDLTVMKVAQLKDFLRTYGLKVTGNKPELLERATEWATVQGLIPRVSTAPCLLSAEKKGEVLLQIEALKDMQVKALDREIVRLGLTKHVLKDAVKEKKKHLLLTYYLDVLCPGEESENCGVAYQDQHVDPDERSEYDAEYASASEGDELGRLLYCALISTKHGLPTKWVVTTMMAFELVLFSDMPFEEWTTEHLSGFFVRVGLTKLADHIRLVCLTGANARTSCTLPSLEEAYLEEDTIFEQLALAAEALEIGPALRDHLPRRGNTGVARDANSSPASSTHVFDNIDAHKGRDWHYTMHVIFRSRFCYDHLSSTQRHENEQAPSPSLTSLLPGVKDEFILRIEFIYEFMLVVCEFIPYFKQFSGFLPPRNHYNKVATQEESVMIGVELITEASSTTPGMHKCAKHMNAQALSVDVVVPAPQDPAGPRHGNTLRGVADHVKIQLLLLVICVYGDGYSEEKLFAAQRDTTENGGYPGIRALFADWHAKRIDDLKYWGGSYSLDQAGEAGTLPWLMKQINMLRKVPTNTNTHYDRQRETRNAIGNAHILALLRFVMRMPALDGDPCVPLPDEYSKSNATHVLAYLLAVGTTVVENYIMSMGSVDNVGRNPTAAYQCGICREDFTKKPARDTHQDGCLRARIANELGPIPERKTSIRKSDFHFDLIWKHLFAASFYSNILVGNGFRVVVVLYKYLLATYDGVASNKMTRLVTRLLLETVVDGGRFSEVEAAQAICERVVSKRTGKGNRAIDLAIENVNRTVREVLDVLKANHTKAEAQAAVNKGAWNAQTQNNGERSLSDVKLGRKARRTNLQRVITCKITPLLLLEGVFTPAAKNEVYESVRETRTFKIDPMSRCNLQRLMNLTVVVRGELDDVSTARCFQQEQQDAALSQLPNAV